MNATDDQTFARSFRASTRRTFIFAATLALFCAACAQDPQKETKQELQTLSSWAATLHLLADSWREGSVPTSYATKTLENAREALRQESQRAQSSSSLAPDARSSLVAHSQSLDAQAGELASAVQREDRSAVPPLANALVQEEQTLAALAQKAGAQTR
jgi:hypothetical protein